MSDRGVSFQPFDLFLVLPTIGAVPSWLGSGGLMRGIRKQEEKWDEEEFAEGQEEAVTVSPGTVASHTWAARSQVCPSTHAQLLVPSLYLSRFPFLSLSLSLSLPLSLFLSITPRWLLEVGGAEMGGMPTPAGGGKDHSPSRFEQINKNL